MEHFDSDTHYFVKNYGPLNDSIHDSIVNGTVSNPIGYGSITTFLRACFVLLLRIGFILIQLGSVPIENIYIILMHNIVDIAVSILSFGLIGYTFAYGNDKLKFIGFGIWIGSTTVDFDEAVLGFCAIIITTGIITTLLSGRLHVVAYVLNSLLVSALIQPLIIHWIWQGNGWMHKASFMSKIVSMKDHSGGLVIHVCGGLFGFVGALTLGRRLILLQDIEETSIGVDAPANILIGYIFIALGLIAFSLPSPFYNLTHSPENYIAVIIVNHFFALAAGIMVVVILHWIFYNEAFNYWIILRCIQGGIVGIVALSSGVDVYHPLFALLLSVLAAIVFYFITICVRYSAIEDYSNIISIHLVGGLLSALFPPMFGSHENLGYSVHVGTGLVHAIWQIICIATVVLVIAIVATIYFVMLNVGNCLRNKNESINHDRGETMASMAENRCFLQRLFALTPTTPHIQPGSVKAPVANLDASAMPVSQSSKDIKAYNMFDIQRPKSIYTVTQVCNYPTGNLCSYGLGDAEQALIKKSINDKFIDKRVTCYDLHRTRKSTNIFLDSKTLSMFDLDVTYRQESLTQSLDCITYDKTFTDDFITLKVPSKCYDGNISDD